MIFGLGYFFCLVLFLFLFKGLFCIFFIVEKFKVEKEVGGVEVVSSLGDTIYYSGRSGCRKY